MTSGETATGAPGRRTTGGARVSVALGAVLCALAVVPGWSWPPPDRRPDRYEGERIWTAGPDWAVWQVDPWWSVAVLLGVAGCLAAARGRPARARALTLAALALLLLETVAAARGGWRAGGPVRTTGSWTWLLEADPDWPTGPTPVLRAAVAAGVTGALGLVLWRWSRRDRWGAAAVGTAVAAAGVAAVAIVGRTDPSSEYPLVGRTVSESYSSVVRLSLGGHPAGSLPGLPGWAVAAAAGVLVWHLLALRGRSGPERHVRVGGWTRDVAALGLVGSTAAVLVLGSSPWWTEWTALPLTDDPWTAFLWEPSAWWVLGVALGGAGGALGVWALRVGPVPSGAGLPGWVPPPPDMAVVVCWTGAAVFVAHPLWGLVPPADTWSTVVAAALVSAQAIGLHPTCREGGPPAAG